MNQDDIGDPLLPSEFFTGMTMGAEINLLNMQDNYAKMLKTFKDSMLSQGFDNHVSDVATLMYMQSLMAMTVGG